MKNAETAIPYKGAKEHYVLDIDNSEFSKKIVSELEKITNSKKENRFKKFIID